MLEAWSLKLKILRIWVETVSKIMWMQSSGNWEILKTAKQPFLLFTGIGLGTQTMSTAPFEKPLPLKSAKKPHYTVERRIRVGPQILSHQEPGGSSSKYTTQTGQFQRVQRLAQFYQNKCCSGCSHNYLFLWLQSSTRNCWYLCFGLDGSQRQLHWIWANQWHQNTKAEVRLHLHRQRIDLRFRKVLLWSNSNFF